MSHPAQRTKLMILGAGCSKAAGYPLAGEMRSQLRAFADSLAQNPKAVRLQQLVAETIRLFDYVAREGHDPRTLDTVAELLSKRPTVENYIKRKLTEQEQRALFVDLVEQAKLAVAAMFLAREQYVLPEGITGYNRLWEVILQGGGTSALATTPYRVISFNYDRLLELAFRDVAKPKPELLILGPDGLNTGLRRLLDDPIKVERNRFALLKLHGSVDFYCYEHPSHETRAYHWGPPDKSTPVPITDGSFFHPAGTSPYANRPKPTVIIFPHEKRYLKEFPGNLLPFRNYLPEVENAALEFAGQAEEIRAIGYTFQPADQETWGPLLASAQPDCRIIVQDKFAAQAHDTCKRIYNALLATGKQPKLAYIECGFEEDWTKKCPVPYETAPSA